MRIDFFGLPGSGKTYLAKKLAQSENRPFVHVGHFFGEFFYSFVFALLHPIFTFFFLWLLLKETYPNWRLIGYKLNRFLFYYPATEQKARWAGKNAIVDEGFFIALNSIYERKITATDLKWLHRIVPKNRMIYIVDTPKEKRNERMKERGRHPRKKFGEVYTVPWMKILEHNHEVIKAFIQENFNYKIIKN